MAHTPVVFISSTEEDLREHREQAAKAALACGFFPLMMEYFPANGEAPSLAACLKKVEEAEVVVVIVAHRYGWVPDDPSNVDAKSITWLECEHARNVTHKEVLAFLVDPKYDWRLDWKENYRLITETDKRGIKKEVRRNERKLDQFKGELNRYFRRKFTDPASLRAEVVTALADWSKRYPTIAAAPPGDPEIYLKALEDDTRQIRVTGLKTKRAEPYFFGIDEIYIPLTTVTGREKGGESAGVEQQKRTVLERALSQRKLVIIGDPGAGKSTFLRRVTFDLCRTLRKTRPAGAAPFLAPNDRRFPIFIRIADLAELLAVDQSPKPSDAPDWIPYFLGKQSDKYGWGLDEAFFRRKLAEGNCLVMVDGLDEAPDRRMRKRIARLFERATQSFRKCDFLVSTRPQSYAEDSVLGGFHAVRIEELEPGDVRTFFEHFARALALNDTESKKFKEELQTALDSRFEIRDMARNPVMLTALAVLQYNDQRLPEYRVELYGSILGWMAAAREYKEDRPSPEKCLEYMRKLALSMQGAPGGPAVQMSKRRAAEILVGEFGGSVDANEELLEREMQDSGIVYSVGADFRFSHLSFQDYLAARAIAGLSEREAWKLLFEEGRIYQTGWREVVLLLAATLRLQGTNRANWLIKQMLEDAGEGSLRNKAMCLVILDAILRDLQQLDYYLPQELRVSADSIIDTLSRSDLTGLQLRLRLELADAASPSEPVIAHNLQATTIPASVLLEHALNDADVETRDLAANVLVALHFDDAEVRSALLRVAQLELKRPIRRLIERAFEDRFPRWKRWLAGLEGDDKIPEVFEGSATPLRVVRVRLKNIKVFEDTGIVQFESRCPLFVGENSAGKSTLLRCIALALAGVELANQIESRALSYLRSGAEEGAIEASFAFEAGLDSGEEFVIGLAIHKGETGFRPLDAASMTLSLHNCASRLDILRRRSDDRFGFFCAYGPFRTFSDPSSLIPTKDKITLDRIASLFDPHAPVIDPELLSKLLSGDLANFRDAPELGLSPNLLDAMRMHLRCLLPGSDSAGTGVSTGVLLHGSAVAFRDLSDGYSSLVALIGHLFRFALVSSKWVGDPAAISGIALIDEIDAHLHPSWQRRVLPDLARVFPKLQILTTTHSPLVAGSIDAQSVHHLVRSQETGGVEIRKYEMHLQGLEADEILTGPLFGLEDTRDLGTEREERRYDELRQLTSATPEEIAEREALAKRLFGEHAESLGRAAREVFAALQSSLTEKISADSAAEKARGLAEAERLIEKMLAGR